MKILRAKAWTICAYLSSRVYQSPQDQDNHKLEGHLTRRQVRLMIDQLLSNEFLLKEGEGAATIYRMTDAFKQSSAIFARAFDLGLEEMRKRGELQ